MSRTTISTRGREWGGQQGGGSSHIAGDEDAVVDADRPAVDKDKHEEVGDLVDWEEEGVEVIGCALSEAIQWVEGMRGPRGGDLPQVVELVDGAVENGVVEEPAGWREGGRDENDGKVPFRVWMAWPAGDEGSTAARVVSHLPLYPVGITVSRPGI